MNKFICAAAALVIVAGFTVSAHAEKDRLGDIHAAKEKLEHAKTDLQKAGDEYGGHRAKAIEHIDGALAEIHAAEEFANAHPQDEHHEHH